MTLKYKASVFLLVLLVSSEARKRGRASRRRISFDFNCQSDCGKYDNEDNTGRSLHKVCTAMEESQECQQKFVLKKKKKKSSEVGSRIIGGHPPKKPMPWMTLIYVKGIKCGGTLINNQFVLTAAHCFCAGANLCKRMVMEVEKNVPNRIRDDVNVGDAVIVYVGMTKLDFLKEELGAHEIFNKYKDDVNHAFRAKKIFLHPKLQTSKFLISTPDIALVQLERPVKFSSYVRPICLNFKGKEKPVCPDQSRDRSATMKDKKRDIAVGDKVLGGCATVAGWGDRYDQNTIGEDGYASCRTDASDLSPDKLQFCESSWESNGEERTNCTSEDLNPDDLTKPCKLFIRELEFNKQLNNRRSENEKDKSYNLMDINGLSAYTKAPIEIEIKINGRNNKKSSIIFHCGKTELIEDEKKTGWCATKLDREGKIERWGFCRKACTDQKDSFMFANMNLLTDDECLTLFRQNRVKGEGGEWKVYFNSKWELCVGKKNQFPKELLSFRRRRKKNSQYEKEKKDAKSLGLPDGFQPTRFKYFMKPNHTRESLGTKESYPYDWFIGGVDSCQGDSGGPLWRNIERAGEVRATQIGVVSRGKGCAGFNDPAIYVSVKKIYRWIHNIVRRHKSNNVCK